MRVTLGDLGLICFLQFKGVNWLSLERQNGRVVAYFEDTPTFRDLRKIYIQDQAVVPPRSFLALFRDLKGQVRDFSLQQTHPPTMRGATHDDSPWPDPPR